MIVDKNYCDNDDQDSQWDIESIDNASKREGLKGIKVTREIAKGKGLCQKRGLQPHPRKDDSPAGKFMS